MSVSLDEWVNTHVKKYSNYTMQELSYLHFFREEPRATVMDDSYFSSPADGIILYQKVVSPTEQIVEIKGKNYTLSQVLSEDVKTPALVIGVFMTFYDVHINRVPMSGYLNFRKVEPIVSRNVPMLFLEKNIFEGNMHYTNQSMNYLFHNERCVNTIYNAQHDYKYYVVQIADDDVDLIMPFCSKGQHYVQNSRFSLIRWGSQCELVLPIDQRFDFETLIPDHYHVEAGIDRLVKIVKTV